MGRKAGRKGKCIRSLLCAPPSSAINHEEERLFTVGVKVPDTFTSSFRRAIVVIAHPVHAAATVKIISNRPRCPGAILTRFINSSHKRTFKIHLAFLDKTSTMLSYQCSVFVCLLNPYLFAHINLNVILFSL